MPNDAKLGLVVGVGLVIAIGVVFFRKEPTPPATEGAPAAVSGSGAASTLAGRGQFRPAPAKTALRNETSSAALTAERRHTVAEGETLQDLAQHYYGDLEQVEKIRRANPDLTSDTLEPGTMLVIPEAKEPIATEEASAAER
jgi:nucleoid-associated protein YgaU